MGDLTRNFSRYEFGLSQKKAAEYGCAACAYPEEWVALRLLPLCQQLERIRDACGGRVVVVISGYRPRDYDLRRIAAGHSGVSPNSQHHDGRAADIQVVGVPAPKVYEVATRLYNNSQIVVGGLGLYTADDFIHVDIRPLPQGERAKTW